MATKCVFFTDAHITGKTPIGRTEKNFAEVIFSKLWTIFSWSMTNGVDAIISGGDDWDRSAPAYSLVMPFARMLRQAMIPFYTVAGQHVMVGHNISEVQYGPLGVLAEAMPDLFQILPNAWESDQIAMIGDFRVTSFPFRHEGEQRLAEGLAQVGGRADIVVVHQMVTDAQKPFPHVLVSDLPCSVPLVLCGDYHPGFGRYTDTTKFINPGALVRRTRSPGDMGRQPMFLVIEGPPITVQAMMVPHNTDCWAEVVEKPGMDEDALRRLLFEISQISTPEAAGIDPVLLVQQVAERAQIDPLITACALRMLTAILEKDSQQE